MDRVRARAAAARRARRVPRRVPAGHGPGRRAGHRRHVRDHGLRRGPRRAVRAACSSTSRATSRPAGGCRQAWAPLVERRATRGVLPIQFALAGMNAHINHDLALARRRHVPGARRRARDGVDPRRLREGQRGPRARWSGRSGGRSSTSAVVRLRRRRVARWRTWSRTSPSTRRATPRGCPALTPLAPARHRLPRPSPARARATSPARRHGRAWCSRAAAHVVGRASRTEHP